MSDDMETNASVPQIAEKCRPNFVGIHGEISNESCKHPRGLCPGQRRGVWGQGARLNSG